MMKYAYVHVNFDNNGLIDGPSSVKYDGYDSKTNKVNYEYYLSYYNLNKGVTPESKDYQSSAVPEKCKIKNDTYSLIAFQNFDEVMIVNTKGHSFSI